ncbi:MAG: hypothetical protein ACUVTM_03605 [Candidatus Bathyarchaeia archaeon]
MRTLPKHAETAPIVESIILFVGLPLALGQISRKVLVEKRGELWFKGRFRIVTGNIAATVLLAAIIILFSLKGEEIASQPLLVGLISISIPLLTHFFVMGYTFLYSTLGF